MVEPNGTSVKISVTDNGPGMTEEVKKRAFETFFTTKVNGKGTGLGLGISQKIVQDHGGQIEIESKIGEGTCFKINIPELILEKTA